MTQLPPVRMFNNDMINYKECPGSGAICKGQVVMGCTLNLVVMVLAFVKVKAFQLPSLFAISFLPSGQLAALPAAVAAVQTRPVLKTPGGSRVTFKIQSVTLKKSQSVTAPPRGGSAGQKSAFPRHFQGKKA